ncbi:hypothetical protein MRY87_12490, partial [bacterium]|nr:hypothetical protein [bacterium]
KSPGGTTHTARKNGRKRSAFDNHSGNLIGGQYIPVARGRECLCEYEGAMGDVQTERRSALESGRGATQRYRSTALTLDGEALEAFAFRREDSAEHSAQIRSEVHEEIVAQLLVGFPPATAEKLRGGLHTLLFRDDHREGWGPPELSHDQKSVIRRVLQGVDEGSLLTPEQFRGGDLDTEIGGLPFIAILKLLAENRCIQNHPQHAPSMEQIGQLFPRVPYFSESFLQQHLADVAPDALCSKFAALPPQAVDPYHPLDLLHGERSRTLRSAYLQIIAERQERGDLPLNVVLPNGVHVEVKEVDLDIHYRPALWADMALLHGMGDPDSEPLLSRPRHGAHLLLPHRDLPKNLSPLFVVGSGPQGRGLSLQPVPAGAQITQEEALSAVMSAVGADPVHSSRQRAILIP